MMNSWLMLLFSLALCFSISWGALSSIYDYDTFTPFTQTADEFITCIQSNITTNETSINQLILTPANSSFLPTWQVGVHMLRFNKSSTPKPSVIVTPIDEFQIRTVLLCAKQVGYELRIRDGGHDFEGLSYTANVPFVMLDLNIMRSVDVDVANRTAWVQPGAVLGEVYYGISQASNNTLYFTGGLCATVGISGFVTGGGYGYLLRKYGLGADNVIDVRFMDVNGNILNRTTMGEDLFWAIRGGMASSFGIVLEWKLRLLPVPEIVTVFNVNKTLEQNATEIVYKYQYVVPKIDRNLVIRSQLTTEFIGNTTQQTIRVFFFGLYLGSSDTLLELLDEKFPELNVTREVCQEVPMVQASIILGGFPSNTTPDILLTRPDIIRVYGKQKLDYVRTPIPISGLEKIWRKMFETNGTFSIFLHPYGGIMDDFSETVIPFPHRAGVLYHLHQIMSFAGEASDTTPVSLQRISWIRGFFEFIASYVSKNPREAYINYNDLDLGVESDTYAEASVWGERYWGRSNFKKLIRIKARVDPGNFFRHPQSIPVFSKSLADM
ncbi:berberine bridge enzyme-like 24 [Rutidosis leptorrhynchoides]|uniref:berberine bridge enzyme-like 24 n=1 Tax=Rutidosis leptorrhynchoides TaxID=125765 RepID=UPI003A999D5B